MLPDLDSSFFDSECGDTFPIQPLDPSQRELDEVMPGPVRVVSRSTMFGSWTYVGSTFLTFLDAFTSGLTDGFGNPPSTSDPLPTSLPNIKCAYGWVATATSDPRATVTVSGTYYKGEPGAIGAGTDFLTPAVVCEAGCGVKGQILYLPTMSDVKLYVQGTHKVDTGNHANTYETSSGMRTKDGKYIPFEP